MITAPPSRNISSYLLPQLDNQQQSNLFVGHYKAIHRLTRDSPLAPTPGAHIRGTQLISQGKPNSTTQLHRLGCYVCQISHHLLSSHIIFFIANFIPLLCLYLLLLFFALSVSHHFPSTIKFLSVAPSSAPNDPPIIPDMAQAVLSPWWCYMSQLLQVHQWW